MSKKIVRASELDPDFKFDIAKTHEGETVLWCVQCGMCTANCPYSEVWDVKPHEIIKMILLGLREQALNCKSMWTCATCFMCAERCPQGVEVGNVKSIKFVNLDSAGQIELKLRVKESVTNMITVDASIRLGTIGMLGDKYVEIIPGTLGR